MASVRSRNALSTRTGWADHKRLVTRGLVCVQVTPTNGRKAQYRLCVDPALLDFEAMPGAASAQTPVPQRQLSSPCCQRQTRAL
jgi:hypothetical protein